MSNNGRYPVNCSDEFAGLCALAAGGELTPEERARLQEHIGTCDACAALIGDYGRLAQVGMVELAAELDSGPQVLRRFDQKKAERRFASALRAADGPPAAGSKRFSRLAAGWLRGRAMVPLVGVMAAVVPLLCIAAAFELGRTSGAHSRASSPAPFSFTTAALQPPAPAVQNTDLQRQLVVARESLDRTRSRLADSGKQIAQLSEERAALLTRIARLTDEQETSAKSVKAILLQRDALQQQLGDLSITLQRVRQDLAQAQQDRHSTLLRITDLEAEVGVLHSELSRASSAASNSEQFLAEDRDIRELMGARQLYIADVFDVQNDGRRSKPFGRIFYTQGKSLIFYAFDLQAQPGYREAKAFQAWGKRDIGGAEPISLGIFYLDSQQNRRWVLESDSPDLLAQINAVFVTVEPHGGSQKPTGKPFLEAYLHSLSPNHP